MIYRLMDRSVELSFAAQRILEERDGGRLAFAPPATEQEVTAFEREHGITVPTEYRWFLLNVGNGGYGPPWYGLEPLSARVIEDNPRMADNHNDRLAEPFCAEACTWEGVDDPEEADRQWQSHQDGRLVLGTDGCALLYVLVVTGDARGAIWEIADVGARPHATSFLDWYSQWLADRGPRATDPVPRALPKSEPEAPSAVRRASFIRRLRGDA